MWILSFYGRDTDQSLCARSAHQSPHFRGALCIFPIGKTFFKRGKDCFTENGSGLDAGDLLDVVDDERFNPDVLGSCWSLSVLDLKCQFSKFVKLSGIVFIQRDTCRISLCHENFPQVMGTFQ